MQPDGRDTEATLALNTKLEEDFISPLTAVRGALEIFRDFDDLDARDRRRFAQSALQACIRLERGVDDLARRVYASAEAPAAERPEPRRNTRFAGRMHVLERYGVVDLDQSGLVFKDAATVNAFYDEVEALVEETGRDWYFTVDCTGSGVWPEAWVAFAHRGKRLHVSHALGTARYSRTASGEEIEAGQFLPSRAAAIEYLTQRPVGADADEGRDADTNKGGSR